MSSTYLLDSFDDLEAHCRSLIGPALGHAPTQTDARVRLLHHHAEAQGLYPFFLYAGLEDLALAYLLVNSHLERREDYAAWRLLLFLVSARGRVVWRSGSPQGPQRNLPTGPT